MVEGGTIKQIALLGLWALVGRALMGWAFMGRALSSQAARAKIAMAAAEAVANDNRDKE